jgi:hypothetical protein
LPLLSSADALPAEKARKRASSGKKWASLACLINAYCLKSVNILLMMSFFRKFTREKSNLFKKKVVKSGKKWKKGLLLNPQ